MVFRGSVYTRDEQETARIHANASRLRSDENRREEDASGEKVKLQGPFHSIKPFVHSTKRKKK
jgi:hypothetical protein